MKKTKLIAVLAASGLLISGCAGGNNGGSPGSDTIKVALASATVSVGYPYLNIPEELDIFDDHGVYVEVLPVDGTSSAIALLGSGQVDVAIGSPEVVVLASAEGDTPLKCIYMLNVENTWQLQVKESSGIRSISDLKGKTVGVPTAGSSADKYLEVRLADEGISVNIEAVGYGVTAAEALESEKIDALVYWTTAIAAFRNADYSMRTLPGAEWEKGLYNFCVFTTDEIIKNKPEQLKKFLGAMSDASYLTVAEPALGVNTFWKLSPGAKGESFKDDFAIVEAQAEAMGLKQTGDPADRFWGQMSDSGWDQFQDYLLKAQLLTSRLDPGVLYTNDLLTEYSPDHYKELLDGIPSSYKEIGD